MCIAHVRLFYSLVHCFQQHQLLQRLRHACPMFICYTLLLTDLICFAIPRPDAPHHTPLPPSNLQNHPLQSCLLVPKPVVFYFRLSLKICLFSRTQISKSFTSALWSVCSLVSRYPVFHLSPLICLFSRTRSPVFHLSSLICLFSRTQISSFSSYPSYLLFSRSKTRLSSSLTFSSPITCFAQRYPNPN